MASQSTPNRRVASHFSVAVTKPGRLRSRAPSSTRALKSITGESKTTPVTEAGQRGLIEELHCYCAAHAKADQHNVLGAGLGQGVLHGGVEVLPFGEAVLMDTAWVLGLAFVVTVGDEKGWDAEVVQDRQQGQTVCRFASKTMDEDCPCVVASVKAPCVLHSQGCFVFDFLVLDAKG